MQIEFLDSNQDELEVLVNSDIILINKQEMFLYLKKNNLLGVVDEFYNSKELDDFYINSSNIELQDYFRLPFEVIKTNIDDFLTKQKKND